MLAGLSRENKAKLNLGDANDYKYLTGGGSVICEGRDDAAEFADIRSAMKVLYVHTGTSSSLDDFSDFGNTTRGPALIGQSRNGRPIRAYLSP